MRDRAWRRAQTDRYKEKSRRDYQQLNKRDPDIVSDTRHSMDCGRRCFLCHSDKLLNGHTITRRADRNEIDEQLFSI